MDSTSVGDSFHRRMGSVSRDSKRRCCSVSLTENQYLCSRMPSSTSMRSKIGHWRRNRRYSSGVQKPITRSTPHGCTSCGRTGRSRRQPGGARRTAGSTTASAAARWARAARRSVRCRGLRYSVTRLIVEPLPAASRPSKTTTTRSPSRADPLLHRDQLGLQAHQLGLVDGLPQPMGLRHVVIVSWNPAHGVRCRCGRRGQRSGTTRRRRVTNVSAFAFRLSGRRGPAGRGRAR